MNEKAERINGWGLYDRCDRSNGILCRYWSTYPRCMVTDMLVIAFSMIGGFIFAALLTDGDFDDDDNGPGGGMMIPAYAPSPSN